jgi:quercetin dioxygenase-like cupin family protein
VSSAGPAPASSSRPLTPWFLAVDVPVGSGPPPHEHAAADEWFYVLEGTPVFHVADRAVTLHEGAFVHIPMGTKHWFEAIDGPVRVLAGHVPGGEELAVT